MNPITPEKTKSQFTDNPRCYTEEKLQGSITPEIPADI